MSKSALLVKNLQAGKEFTAKQIGASFGFVNPYRAVEALRQQGHCIYGNKRTLSTGEQVIKFRMGSPSKKMVAITNAVLGSAAFTR
jgi:hypothetical protein